MSDGCSDPEVKTEAHPGTGEAPYWFLPDGRPVYRRALLKRWLSLGSPQIPLGERVSVTSLSNWLHPGNESCIDLETLALVVDFLETNKRR